MMKTHNNRAELKVIARIHNDFTEKFGIPQPERKAEPSESGDRI